MKHPRRHLLAGMGATALTASLLFSTGCKPKHDHAHGEGHDHASHAGQASQPKSEALPFTGKLVEIEGVQAIYSLRHPKLILGDLDKLMTEVPETALLRMFLGQLAPFGYPEFTELAADSNIGIALLNLTPETLEAGTPEFVAFAKLKENGKIWNALAQSGFTLEKRDEWTWIAQDPVNFAKISAPAAIFEQVSQPQTQEIRVWGQVSPALLDLAKNAVLAKLESVLETRSPAEQQAAKAYADVIWGYLAQVHSGGGSLDLADDRIALEYFAQFKPETPTGILLRNAHGPAPKLAQYVPADGIFSAVMRQNIPAQIDFVNGLFDALIAVDYPAGADALKSAKTGYLAMSKNSDGGGVVTVNMSLPKGTEAPDVRMFGVNSGSFSEEAVFEGYKTTSELSSTFTNTLLASMASLTPMAPKPSVTQTFNDNALTIDGVRFGSITTTTKIEGVDDQVTHQYFGVANGLLVFTTSEAELRAKLPALLAKKPVSNPVSLTFANDEFFVGAVHGENIVDMVLAGLALDRNDADVQAQIESLKKGYTDAAPVKLTASAGQAKASLSLAIPYKFISQSVKLGQFASAYESQEQPESLPMIDPDLSDMSDEE